MKPFEHEHAASARIVFAIDRERTLTPTKLVVLSKIPLLKNSAGYSASKVDSLTRSVAGYARTAKIDEIIFESEN